MRFLIFILATTVSVSTYAKNNEHQETLDSCIGVWPNAPFKKGAQPDKVMSIGVKVFGIGKQAEVDNSVTSGPSLVLVRPSVNVLGKTTIQLLNPNGWYCLKANVSVLGKVDIQAHCKAHVASANEGTEVLAADDSNGGVSVLGSIRITRVGCK